jgi:putative transposase
MPSWQLIVMVASTDYYWGLTPKNSLTDAFARLTETMRRPRLILKSALAHYHCVNRVCDKQHHFSAPERHKFVFFLRLYEAFCGVRVLTYCVLSNHFHLLVEVPQRPKTGLDEAWLLNHVKKTLGPVAAQVLSEKLEGLRKKSPKLAEDLVESYFRRMWNLSEFMKALKQRFTQWFNVKYEREGTLWEARFKSVAVEGRGSVLAAMAAYIDLNPVRAGLVSDPKDYAWSGYASAVAGDKRAVGGLREVLKDLGQGVKEAADVLARYRVHLYNEGREVVGNEQMGVKGRPGLKREAVAEVMKQQGQLSEAELLGQRVRHFSDGAVLGGQEFVEATFREWKAWFGARRRVGAHPLGMIGSEALFTLRPVRETDAADEAAPNDPQ